MAFSEDMIEKWCPNDNKQAYTSTQKPIDAAARVRELLALEPDAIPRLRAVQLALNKSPADIFGRAGLNVSPALVASFPKN
ncbi:hypothetical protein C5960_21350 [Cronobacter sakazakii]|nr:hypothetical protein C3D66_08325 [Cronobacter sakazakii]PQV73812.1 hypothetical protein CDT91_19890 [Cronobacter sakazakii]PQY25354.1 hypothetical protein C5961_16845 [Cronobacter sakazakii]PQZ03854.1 hypothetical protein C5960_21350 [Cronobacter sakazakii]PQZ24956.1 hypothetical protein C5971_21085 [Cronobacter sakazakii]